MELVQSCCNAMALREWAPLTDLFSKLPTRNQNGIFQQEIKLTCVDVLPEFVALGTNVGLVFWFDRKKKDMKRLRCENPNVPITCVKVISTVDFMLACGNNVGNISIFQIPKSHPDSIPENLKPKNKQVERYTVTELHNAPISAIEWSKNGMKLFSGDKNGCVVLTEIDFYMHICKSMEILNETYEVVQLSYNVQRLLVSTTYRSIICLKDDKWKVCQVGKKDRKILGSFGGVVFQKGHKISDTCLYCIRPGLRIWVADINGNVQKTLLFRELLSKECPEVPIINPISRNLRSLKPSKEPSFGVLLPFVEDLLVTHNNDIVYILNPSEMTILYTISHLRGVLDVATHKDEIFILEEERSLIRISYKPETMSSCDMFSLNSSFLPITSIKGLTTKLQSSSIISAIPPLLESTLGDNVNIHTDENLIMNAEEAKESPIKCQRDQKKFDDIGKQEFSDKILYKKSKNHKKHSKLHTSTMSLSSNSSEDKDLSYTRPTIMNLSTVGVLPDLRSPESIKYDIEYKEKILADVLNLDKIKIKTDILPEEDNSKKNSQSQLNEDINLVRRETISEDDYRLTNIGSDHKNISTSSLNDSTDNGVAYTASISPKRVLSPPACMDIPNEWKLSNIQLRDRKISSDNSFSDWELV